MCLSMIVFSLSATNSCGWKTVISTDKEKVEKKGGDALMQCESSGSFVTVMAI